jgi:hypothetical protein
MKGSASVCVLEENELLKHVQVKQEGQNQKL